MKRILLTLAFLLFLSPEAHTQYATQHFTGVVADISASGQSLGVPGFFGSPIGTVVSGSFTINSNNLGAPYAPNFYEWLQGFPLSAGGIVNANPDVLTVSSANGSLNVSSINALELMTTLDLVAYSSPTAVSGHFYGGELILNCDNPVLNGGLAALPLYIPKNCAAQINFSDSTAGYGLTVVLTSLVGTEINQNKLNGGCGCGGANSSVLPTPEVAEPINTASGNLFETVPDYATAGPNVLSFTRYYNSLADPNSLAISLGAGWRSTFDRYLRISATSITAERPDGQELTFTLQNGVWASDSDIDVTLTNSGTNWTLTDRNDGVETYTAISSTEATLSAFKGRNGYARTLSYNGSKQLTSVTDSFGRSLTFTYLSGLLQTVTTPDGLTLSYSYTSSGLNAGVLDRLASVTYSTSPQTSQTYLYENTSLLFSLTGITDEDGNRYATWAYDGTGRAVSNFMGTAANQTTVAYDDTTGNRTITNALGESNVYKFTTLQGIPKLTEIDRQATSTTAAATELFTYDANGYVASQTDWNGNQTTFVNDVHGQPTTTVEAVGTMQTRTTAVTYLSGFHLPSQVVRPGITTSFTYDGSGNLLTKTMTDTTTSSVPYSTNGQNRVSTFTYGNYGLPATAKTARSDVNGTTTYAYSQGALTKITNALSQSVNITNTAGGRPVTVVDANGVTTTLGYDPRQRLTSRAVATAAGTLTTSFGYDAAGNLLSTTLPDGSSLTNTYDTAHRLTKVTDSLGNYTSYTLDGFGDRTQTSVYTSAGTLTWQGTGTFDALGRELVHTAGAGQTTTKTYDSNGNVLTVADGLNHTTTNTYDALNRLSTSTDANGGVTTPVYDTNDRVVSVTDANDNATTYVRDGFGDVLQQSSPDSGVSIFHYDSDANLTSKTDALSIVTNQTFDALDRPLTTTYPAHTAENVAYTYDQTGTGFSFGVGRLTSVTDASGSEARAYDERGNLQIDKHVNGSTTLTSAYTYDGASRIASMAYPDGTLVTYQHDAAGYVSAATAKLPSASSATPLASISHQPFGPISGVSYGNGVAETWTFDQAYRPTSILDALSGANLQSLTYVYDNANNVSSITDAVNTANSQTFTYDVINRLTKAVSGTGGYGTQSWTYDKVGNRLTQVQGTTTTTYGYTPNTNKLLTISAAPTSGALHIRPFGKLRPDSGLILAANGPPAPSSAKPAEDSSISVDRPYLRFAGLVGWPALFLGSGVLWSYRKRLREHRFILLIAGILFTGGAAAIIGCGSTNQTVATPTFSPPAGTYSAAQSVTISDSSSGVSIYYTTDGSTPTTNSTKYSTPIAVSSTETIQAMASGTGRNNSGIATATYTINPLTAATPVFSPAGGTFTASQSVTISDTTSGAKIYYTTDGTTPTINSSQYSAPISITATETLQAIAVASGYANSAIATATYTLTQTAATPVFSLPGGTFTSPQTVAISDSTAGAAIYYTTDGSTPTVGSTRYNGPITVSATETISAIAVASGYSNSAVATAAFTIALTASAPTFSPLAGGYSAAQTVTIADATPGAVIYYTTDGSVPTPSSIAYGGPLKVSSSETINALAVAAGYTNSAISSATYTISLPVAATPVFSPSAVINATPPQIVTITDSTPGATIYYTVDGSTPTTNSLRYTSALTVTASETIKAIATASGYANSAVGSLSVAFASTTATPVFSPGAGTFSTAQMVSISDATAGATIHYTTNGSAPTTNSTTYSGPISVNSTETLNAIAVASGYSNSNVASATYTINLSPAAPPTFSPAAGTFTSTQTVTISDATAGAAIYYTTDGSMPTASSTRYSGPLTVSTDENLSAIAVAAGYANSAVATAAYVISQTTAAPTFSPAGGTFSSAQTVTLADATVGASIYYTTDGSVPSVSSTKYIGPITVSATETINAIAAASGYTNSGVVTAVYTINLAATATPAFSLSSGTFTSAQTVTISDATPGAAIYYTTDGTTPSATSTRYTSALTVSSTETLEAIAIATGYANSAVVSATYTININSCLNAVTTNANGNITGVPSADGVYCLTFAYNNANRPASVMGGAMAATFIYDWAGQRYSKTDGGSPATVYSYSQDGTVIAENNGGTVTDYIYADGRPIAVVQPTATPSSNQIGYVMADRLGTPQRVTNSSAGTTWSTAYQPFGTTGTVNAAIQQDLRFPGQLADAETGFSYNLFRDYIPSLGRYLESDPLGALGGPNSYAYSGLNPLARIDPAGLQATPYGVLKPDNFQAALNGDLASEVDALKQADSAINDVNQFSGFVAYLAGGVQAVLDINAIGPNVPAVVGIANALVDGAAGVAPVVPPAMSGKPRDPNGPVCNIQ